MKTLILIRHAKSDWGNLNASDFERELSERGRRDAPEMARRAAGRGLIPGLCVASPACRAMQTARLMAPNLALPVEQIEWRDELYLASPAILLDTVRHTPDHIDVLALLAHNPGITDLANRLCPAAGIDNVPTAGIVTLTFATDSWQQIGPGGTLLDFDYPKKDMD